MAAEITDSRSARFALRCSNFAERWFPDSWVSGAVAVITVALATMLMGAKPTDAGPARDITMNMQDAELRAMIQWMADISGKNFIVHKDVKGIATVVSAEPVSVDEAWQMFLQVLELNGFAAVSSGSSVKIVPAPTAARTASSGAAGSAGRTAPAPPGSGRRPRSARLPGPARQGRAAPDAGWPADGSLLCP